MEIPKGFQKIELKKETTLDRIFAWYMQEEGIELTAKEKAQADRYKFCFAAMLNADLDSTIVDKTAAFFSISERQAYRDLSEAKKLYSDINKAGKEADRYILTQYLMKVYQQAMTDLDLKTAVKAIAEIGKIKGLQKEDPDLPNPEAFQASTYLIQLNSTTVNQTIDLGQLSSMPKEEFNLLLDQIQKKDISDLELLKLLNEARTED